MRAYESTHTRAQPESGPRAASAPLAMCVVLLLACLLAGGACQREIHGTFGWSSNDDRGIVEPERSLLLETEFRVGRSNLYFFDYETIWWVYQIQGGSYDRNGFIAALYENNLTPDPVEVDLRRVPIQRNGCCDYIRQYYEDLAPGRYLLKIAHESSVVDQVDFYVVPPGGPAALESEDENESEIGIATDAATVEREFAREGLPPEDSGDLSGERPGGSEAEESDDILRYSSG